MPTPCELHGIDCPICDKLPGQCDYGSCQNLAVTTVPCFNDRGTVSENRPACADHAHYGWNGSHRGVGYGSAKK